MQETQEMQVQTLGQEDPLEEKIATHSTILAWKFHEQMSLAGYGPWGRKEADTTDARVHGLVKPMIWAILAEAGLTVRLPRSYGVLEETSSAGNVTKEEKEGGEYSGISLPPGLQSPANSYPRMEAQKKHGQRVLGGLSVFPVKWRESTKLGKKDKNE